MCRRTLSSLVESGEYHLTRDHEVFVYIDLSPSLRLVRLFNIDKRTHASYDFTDVNFTPCDMEITVSPK